jgi:O-antigen/teichoic acid export membrane protein
MGHREDLSKSPYFIVSGYTGKLISFIFTLFLVRIVSPDIVGMVNMAITVNQTLIIIVTMGSLAILRIYVPHYLKGRDLGTAKGVIIDSVEYMLALSLIFMFLVILFSNEIALGYFKEARFVLPLIVGIFSLPFATITAIMEALLQSLRKFRDMAIIDSGSSLVKLVVSLSFGYYLVLQNASPEIIAAGILVGSIVMNLTSIAFAFRGTMPLLRLWKVERKPLPGKIVRFGYNSASLELVGLGWAHTDKLVIGFFMAPLYWAYYAIAFNVTFAIQVITGSVSKVMLPNLAGAWGEKKIDEFRRVLQDSLRLLTVMALPATMGLVIIMAPLINVLFTRQYIESTLTAQILVLAFFFGGLSSLMSTAITAMERPELIRNYIILAALLNIGLNVIMVQFLGLVGVAIATLATYALLAVMSFHIMRREIGLAFPWRTFFISLACSSAMGIFVYWAKCLLTDGSMVAVLIGIAALIYFALMVLVGEIRRRHIELMESAIPGQLEDFAKPFTKQAKRFVRK